MEGKRDRIRKAISASLHPECAKIYVLVAEGRELGASPERAVMERLQRTLGGSIELRPWDWQRTRREFCKADREAETRVAQMARQCGARRDGAWRALGGGESKRMSDVQRLRISEIVREEPGLTLGQIAKRLGVASKVVVDLMRWKGLPGVTYSDGVPIRCYPKEVA